MQFNPYACCLSWRNQKIASSCWYVGKWRCDKFINWEVNKQNEKKDWIAAGSCDSIVNKSKQIKLQKHQNANCYTILWSLTSVNWWTRSNSLFKISQKPNKRSRSLLSYFHQYGWRTIKVQSLQTKGFNMLNKCARRWEYLVT